MSYPQANNLRGFPGNLLKYVHVSFVLGSPKLDTKIQMLSHLCWTDGKMNYFNLLFTALYMQSNSTQLFFSALSNLFFESSLVSLGIKGKLSKLPGILQSRDLPTKCLRWFNTKHVKDLHSNGPIISFIYREKSMDLKETLFHLIKFFVTVSWLKLFPSLKKKQKRFYWNAFSWKNSFWVKLGKINLGNF